MRYQVILLAALTACAGKSAEVDATPQREVRVLEKGDPALRRISFAAADYLKDVTAGTDVGFSGVYHKRELDVELTREIVVSHAFVDGKSGSGCAATVGAIVSSPRAPTDPARGAPAPPARTATTDNRACANANRRTYGFHKFRVAADTAYIETSGLPQGLACLKLAVKAEGGWKVVDVKPTRAEACGK
jgi:hypothetical protein